MKDVRYNRFQPKADNNGKTECLFALRKSVGLHIQGLCNTHPPSVWAGGVHLCVWLLAELSA